jgi:hypothetical protein
VVDSERVGLLFVSGFFFEDWLPPTESLLGCPLMSEVISSLSQADAGIAFSERVAPSSCVAFAVVVSEFCDKLSFSPMRIVLL